MITTLSEVRYYQDDGLTVLEISGLTGMSRPLIYYWLGQWGLKPHISRRPLLTGVQKKKIAKLRATGLSQRNVAAVMGLPTHQVRYETERTR